MVIFLKKKRQHKIIKLNSHMGNSRAVPQKIKINLPLDPVIPFLSIYPKELKAGSQSLCQIFIR
jgi:hypothetical protein